MRPITKEKDFKTASLFSEYIEINGISINALSKMIGVSNYHLWCVMNKERPISSNLIEKMNTYLNTNFYPSAEM